MNNSRNRRWLFPLIPLVAVAVFSFVVMLLWNAIIPGITGWALLTYWKAMGLLVLCKILFGGFPGRRGGHGGPPWMRNRHMRENWKNMSEADRAAQRAKFKEHWKQRCVGGARQWKQDQAAPEQ